jgi:tetratricopeptide (TPR) repeat protein
MLVGRQAYVSYWGDIRHTVAYGLNETAMALEDDKRAGALEEALSVDPGYWLTNERLAEQDLFAGRLREAEAHLDVAIRANPQSPLANFTMGVVQYRLGSIDAAIPYFLEAARLDPGNLQYEGMVKQLRDIKAGGRTTTTTTTAP